MAESKIFKLPESMSAEQVGRGIENFLRDKKHLMTEGTATPDGYFIQAKGESGWKKVAGLDLATQIQIVQMGGMITVEVGSGKWIDKLGAGAVGMILFAPLAATAALGAVMQKKLPTEIFNFVEQFILSGGQNIVVSSQIGLGDTSRVQCPSCGASVEKGVKFCPSCGEKLLAECPNCHADVALGVKFCPKCGSPMKPKKQCPNCNCEVGVDQKFCPECGQPLK